MDPTDPVSSWLNEGMILRGKRLLLLQRLYGIAVEDWCEPEQEAPPPPAPKPPRRKVTAPAKAVRPRTAPAKRAPLAAADARTGTGG